MCRCLSRPRSAVQGVVASPPVLIPQNPTRLAVAAVAHCSWQDRSCGERAKCKRHGLRWPALYDVVLDPLQDPGAHSHHPLSLCVFATSHPTRYSVFSLAALSRALASHAELVVEARESDDDRSCRPQHPCSQEGAVLFSFAEEEGFVFGARKKRTPLPLS